MKRAWWHQLILLILFAGTLGAAVVYGASSVGTWFDQNAHRADAEHVAMQLEARIAELTAELDRRTSDDGVRREALCFGHYVEPGTELYAVMGLSGCVGQHQGRNR